MQPKKMYAKSLLNDAATALTWSKSWREESPCKEEFALLRESDSLHLAGTMVRRAVKAGIENDWSELLKGSQLNPWTRVKLQECHHEVKGGTISWTLWTLKTFGNKNL